MYRRNVVRRAVDAATGMAKPDLGIPEFVDASFLANKRPQIPGGSWPKEALEKKSLSDLQQIWFILLKEKNMLLSMREHYIKHMEELGAWPAPSRLKMVEDSMATLKEVVRQRDFEATDRAMKIFTERLKQGNYRFPPGPQPKPGTNESTSKVTFMVSKYVPEDRLRELFGKYDVFEEHKGIVQVRVSLPDEVLAAKEKAEGDWDEWVAAKNDFEEYNSIQDAPPSVHYDLFQDLELAPGVRYGDSALKKLQSEGKAKITVDELSRDGDTVVAASVPVPPPQAQRPASTDPLQRMRDEALPPTLRRNVQLGYFPNVTLERPKDPGPRPVHPDEIEGPWHVEIIYDYPDGYEYAANLNISRVDSAEVMEMTDATQKTPFSERCPVYQEALRAEEADAQHQMNWPQVPPLKPNEIRRLQVKPLDEIITHSWTNVVDYTEREALLTGKSIWEMPISVDPSCGDSDKVPPGWTPPPLDAIDENVFLWDNY